MRWSRLLFAAFAACTRQDAPVAGADSAATTQLCDVGPRLTSNQTTQRLTLVGDGFSSGMRLRLGQPISRDVPLIVADARHAYVRLTPPELPADQEQADISLRLVLPNGSLAPGEAKLTVINDSAFVDPFDMAISADGRLLFVISPPTDELFVVDTTTGAVTSSKVGDGPRALTTFRDRQAEWLAIVHDYSPEIWLIGFGNGGIVGEPRKLPAPSYATGIVIDDATDMAFVAEHALDTVRALDLSDGAREQWRSDALPNPRAVALRNQVLAVGSLQTGEIELFDATSGARTSIVAPQPGVSIIGGRTAPFSQYVMGGSAPRDMVWSSARELIVASIGPNIGPNPDRMEVSMNGGLGVVTAGSKRDAAPTFVRHLGFGAGVTEGLALDERRGLLYATDIALGTLRILELAKLTRSDQAARTALRQTIAIEPPVETSLVRPRQDFGVNGRAGIELHSGPRAVALSPDGLRLYVLNRFSGTVAVVDVARAKQGQASVLRQIPLVHTRKQPERRRGQVLFYADLGRTSITCDACHVEGHTGGLLFEKTQPLRIYRSTTVLGSRDTPPYFTPASNRSLEETARFVGDRNRFHNPDLTDEEVASLARYSATLSTPPSPFGARDGSLAPFQLPVDQAGNPAQGLALFEGKAGCASCHPAPLYTTDQDVATRGRYQDVGTPWLLEIRPKMQNFGAGAFAAPSLIGAWDNFPMLSTGIAGISVHQTTAGTQVLQTATRHPLREILAHPHGRTPTLTRNEQNDLYAYLLTL